MFAVSPTLLTQAGAGRGSHCDAEDRDWLGPMRRATSAPRHEGVLDGQTVRCTHEGGREDPSMR